MLNTNCATIFKNLPGFCCSFCFVILLFTSDCGLCSNIHCTFQILIPSCPLSCSSLLTQQLSLLPLMEPLIGINFAHFAPYGSGQLNGENLLSGTFGSASLDGVSDYYSQLAYKVRSDCLTKVDLERQSLGCLKHVLTVSCV